MALLNYDPYFPFYRHGPRYAEHAGALDTFFDDSSQIQLRDHAAKLSMEPNGDFSYKVDVSGFRPNELKVDIEADDIIIRGEHKVRSDNEIVERFFTRRVRIPAGIHKESITCDVDERGRLHVDGHKVGAEQPNRRSIPIGVRASALTEGGREKK